MPSSTLLARHGFRSAGRGSAAREFFHPGAHVSELAHRRAFRIASTRAWSQEMIGHANIRQTMDTYSHVLPNIQQQAAERMDTMLG
jgi:hypothetical protein